MTESPKGGTEYSKGKAITDRIADSIIHYWPMILAGTLFIVMQWQFPFIDWWKSWNKPNSYYSHGPLVPLISLFMIWANRKRMALVKIQPSWYGLLLIIPSIPIFVFGRWTGSGNLCAITFLAFMIGAVLLFTGTRMTRLLLFPLLYLIFMIPAPATVLDKATFPIQYSSTTLATKIINITGYDAAQNGTVITSPDLPEPLRVAGECSGFRMLISLLTFTAFFVYMVRTPFWKKVVLVAISFPLSLFVNGLRIATIGYIGFWTGSADAMHNFHNSWAMVFELVLSFTILFAFARLIRANDFGIPEPKIDPEIAAQTSSTPVYKLVGRGLKGPACIMLFCVILLSNVMIKPLEKSAKGHLDKSNISTSFGNWTSTERKIDQITETELKTADMVDLFFTDSSEGTQIDAMIQAAQDTDAFHDPHSCLPGGGNSISMDKTVTLSFDKPKPMRVKATMLRFTNDNTGDDYMLVYWYANGDESYASTSEARLKMRQKQIHDLTGLLLHRGNSEKLKNDYAHRQTYCYRFTTVVWDDTEPALESLKGFIRQFVANSKQFDN